MSKYVSTIIKKRCWKERLSTFVPKLPSKTDKPAKPKIKYNPTPVWKMTDKDAYAFALRQAQEAADHIRTTDGRMTQEDMQMYAAAIYDSIIWFNRKDKRHAEQMRYLEELREKLEGESAAQFKPQPSNRK